ncbi:hypothetical protein T265_10483 [Opisthorchis viverrini]|uniref:Uncharacterized protein n=1 Tax=Opisthorchis viverrini TaxID=6198 RepID=A0A074Z2A2_OPIVI|nr:hypothetical protein T265_10483 [Opisthorchis viverrini]KER21123.1 hypothetical protein T265_10483 [Opisthorchis viverrini]
MSQQPTTRIRKLRYRAGFCPGRECINHILTLRRVLGEPNSFNHPMVHRIYSSDERNVTRQMMEYFSGHEYRSFAEFQSKLREFQRGTGTCYARRHSLSAAKYEQNVGKVLPPSGGYAFVVYKCVHARSHWKMV